MDAQDYPLQHFDLMRAITVALKPLPAQVLDHEYLYEVFGSWTLVVRHRGVPLRIVFDGKDRYCSIGRSATAKRPYQWTTIGELVLGDDPVASIVNAVREAGSGKT
jgi:hypothetical protein